MRLLTKREVGLRLGFHPESVMRLVRAGRFPKPIKMGASDQSATRFSEDEVEDWIARRFSARET